MIDTGRDSATGRSHIASDAIRAYINAMRNDQQIHGALSPSLIIQAQKSMLEQCRSARLSQSILV